MNINSLTSQNLNNISFPNDNTNIKSSLKSDSTKTEQNDNAEIGDSVSLGQDNKNEIDNKKWTVLHYGAGDNDLYGHILADVREEMQAVGSNENINVVSMLDCFHEGCTTYYVTKSDGSDEYGELYSPVVVPKQENVDMSNSKVLSDFISWGIKNYPSDHVMVVISSHGGGSNGAIADHDNGVRREDYSFDYNMMTPQDMNKAFQEAEKITGKKIDILGFDACLMANTESTYELRNSANYIVASEETEGGEGWGYKKMLNHLSNGNMKPESFAKDIVKSFAIPKYQADLKTLSAIDTSKMNQIANTVDEFSKAILEQKQSADTLKHLNSLRADTQSFLNDSIDLHDFCEKISNDPKFKDSKLQETAKKVMSAVNEAIIANQSYSKTENPKGMLKYSNDDYSNAHGLQIESSKDNIGKNYKSLQFSKDTHWDEALALINNKKYTV